MSKQSHELSLTQLLPPSISHGMWDAFRDQQPHNLWPHPEPPQKITAGNISQAVLNPLQLQQDNLPNFAVQMLQSNPYIITTRQSYEYNSTNAVKLGPVVGFANICFTNPTPSSSEISSLASSSLVPLLK